MNFSEKVLELCKRIPKGKITTYNLIAKKMKRKGQSYRAVGRVLKENKKVVIVPCHRVVCSDGSIGGYAKGIKKKIALLRKEGIEIKNNKIVDFEKRLFRFD